MQKPRSETQKCIAAYLIINGLFLLPANMEYISEEASRFSYTYFGVILFFNIPYTLFLLAFVHLVLNTGFLLYSVLKIILSKERNWVVFVVSVLAVAFSTWANAFSLYSLHQPYA